MSQAMADIKISHHLLKSEAIIVLNDKEYNIYGDAETDESTRVKKEIILRKNVDLAYIETMDDVLLDDGEQLPWVVVLTHSGLPRTLHAEDFIIIEGVQYTISRVKPSNRFRDSIYNCLIYPERASEEDILRIYSIQAKKNGPVNFADMIGEEVTLDILYGGYPTKISINGGEWDTFKSYYKTIVTSELVVSIKDKEKNISTLKVL